MIDVQGNKWFGVAGIDVGGTGGLSKFDGTTWTTYTSEVGIVTAISPDAQDNEWFGTDLGGLVKYDGTNWTTYTDPSSHV